MDNKKFEQPEIIVLQTEIDEIITTSVFGAKYLYDNEEDYNTLF